MIPKFRAWFVGDEESEPEMYDEILSIDFANETVTSMCYIPFLRKQCEVQTNFCDIKLMQSTGLKDKNGREIFEGDIVRTCENKIAKVVWSKVYYQYLFMYYEDNAIKSMPFFGRRVKDFKVIGNIYENEELLLENEKNLN